MKGLANVILLGVVSGISVTIGSVIGTKLIDKYEAYKIKTQTKHA